MRILQIRCCLPQECFFNSTLKKLSEYESTLSQLTRFTARGVDRMTRIPRRHRESRKGVEVNVATHSLPMLDVWDDDRDKDEKNLLRFGGIEG